MPAKTSLTFAAVLLVSIAIAGCGFAPLGADSETTPRSTQAEGTNTPKQQEADRTTTPTATIETPVDKKKRTPSTTVRKPETQKAEKPLRQNKQAPGRTPTPTQDSQRFTRAQAQQFQKDMLAAGKSTSESVTPETVNRALRAAGTVVSAYAGKVSPGSCRSLLVEMAATYRQSAEALASRDQQRIAKIGSRLNEQTRALEPTCAPR